MLFWENSGAMGFHSMLVLVTWVGVMLITIMAAAAIAYLKGIKTGGEA